MLGHVTVMSCYVYYLMNRVTLTKLIFETTTMGLSIVYYVYIYNFIMCMIPNTMCLYCMFCLCGHDTVCRHIQYINVAYAYFIALH